MHCNPYLEIVLNCIEPYPLLALRNVIKCLSSSVNAISVDNIVAVVHVDFPRLYLVIVKKLFC